MPLPMLLGSVAARVGGGLFRRGRAAAGGLARRGIGAVAGRIAPAIGARVAGVGVGRRRRRGIPTLSPNEMGKMMLMAQILGRRSPAMTMIVMKALSGRI